ncbi:MAG: hypothetical protein WCO26_25755, partial [Deltaproteobacteria bacterium]
QGVGSVPGGSVQCNCKVYRPANSLSIDISMQLPHQSHLRIRQISPTSLTFGWLVSVVLSCDTRTSATYN